MASNNQAHVPSRRRWRFPFRIQRTGVKVNTSDSPGQPAPEANTRDASMWSAPEANARTAPGEPHSEASTEGPSIEDVKFRPSMFNDRRGNHEYFRETPEECELRGPGLLERKIAVEPENILSFTVLSCGDQHFVEQGWTVHNSGDNSVSFKELVYYDDGTLHSWINLRVIDHLGLRWNEFKIPEYGVIDWHGNEIECCGKCYVRCPEEDGATAHFTLRVTRDSTFDILLGRSVRSRYRPVIYLPVAPSSAGALPSVPSKRPKKVKSSNAGEASGKQSGDPLVMQHAELTSNGWTWDHSRREFFRIGQDGARIVYTERGEGQGGGQAR